MQKIKQGFKALVLLCCFFISFFQLAAQCSAIPGDLGGTGNYCIGAGVNVGIPNTTPGQLYTWYRNGKPVKKLPADGDGGSVSFNFSASTDLAGNYVVKAQKPGCLPVVFGNVTVTIATGGILAQNVTAAPTCEGSPVPVIMTGSQQNVVYRLWTYQYNPEGVEIGSFPVSAEINGTGGAIDFGEQSDGVYKVLAYGLGCYDAIVGSVNVNSYASVPYSQGFNGPALPACWRIGAPVIGNSPITVQTSSSNPATTPYEGSHYIFWNSANTSTHPAGNESRLLLPQVKPNTNTTLDVEFYWYSNNNTSLSAAQNNNEGVQLQYFSSIWINIGSFIPRHDPTLPANTGQWKKITITIPNVTTNGISLAFKFRSSGGNNCSMDMVTIKETPSCVKPSGLDAISYGTNTMTLGWSDVPGSSGYQYVVSQSPYFPASGTSTTNSTINVGSLNPGTKYYLFVRTQCAYGNSAWDSLSFFTLLDCNTIPVVNSCTNFNISSGIGEGLWNFNGDYPNNSTGNSTPGREALVRFTPSTTGVYYIENISGGSYGSILYKPSSAGGCIDTGWTGIMESSNAKKPIGILEAGVEYLFVFDSWYDYSSVSGTYRICRAGVGAAPTLNDCFTRNWESTIPANSTKEEFVLDDAGNLLASFDFSQVGQEIVSGTVSYYINTAAVRRDDVNREYLDRNFTFTSANYFNQAFPVKIRMYFTNAELNRLINEPNDGIGDVQSITDLNMSIAQYSSCGSSASGYSFNVAPQIGSGSNDIFSSYIDAAAYLSEYANISGFLHGGFEPLNYQCPSPANYPTAPISEGFNTLAPSMKPLCWSEQTFGSNVLFVPSSTNPSTIPFEGSRFILYNSYAFNAGTATRLISAPFKTTGMSSVDVEFYWYNSHNPAYTSNVEGVQLEYSLDGVNFTGFSFLFPRHDASLPVGTGKWNKKRVTLPAAAGNKGQVYVSFVFFSQFGENCALDAVRFGPTPACADVSNINISNITGTGASVNWSAVPGVSTYQYAISTSAEPPASGTATNNTSLSATSLLGQTRYYVHLRAQCSPGVFGGWTSAEFLTAPSCVNADAISLCNPTTVTLSGSGAFDFAGTYPVNSIGYSTPGREKIYQFIPTETGVYYLEVTNASGGYIDYFYRQGAGNCDNTGWTGISDINSAGKTAIGRLQQGQTYYFLLDPESVEEVSQTFRICKATTAPPAFFNECLNMNGLKHKIPANSPKEEFILDNDGNLLAGLNFANVSNNLGFVYSSYLVNSGVVRRDQQNKEYLDRNLTISSDTVPANPVIITLYFRNAELQRLINEPNDGLADVSQAADLKITSLLQGCGNSVESGTGVLLPQTSNAIYDANTQSVTFSAPSFNTFFLHGGNTALFSTGDNLVKICPNGSYSLSSPNFGSGYSYQWQVDAGSGFVNIADNQYYTNTTQYILNLTNLPSSFYGYRYRCIASKGATTITSNIKKLKFEVSWNGSVNTVWSNPANFNCGTLPDANTDVIIPSGLVNYPFVNADGTCRSITVNPGASIQLLPGVKINLTGK